MIKAESITFTYKNQDTETGETTENTVFENISLKIEKGSFVAVLGRNGSGKSTLAKHFNAILTPTFGKVSVLGMDTKSEENLIEIRKNAGMVFQNPDNQTVAAIVEDDVAFAPENLGVEPAEIRKRTDKALKAVGMSDYALSSISMLSGGQKQRVAIAGVLAMEPECIILDEPTAMLDPSGRKEVIETIKELNEKRGITVVLITHYMDEAAKADRVIVMDNGKIILDNTPKKVFKEAKILKDAGLEVPQVTELCCLLREKGIDVPDDITDPEECVNCLKKLFEKREEGKK